MRLLLMATRKSDATEDLSHLCEAQNHWQFLLARRSDQTERGELSAQRVFEEELDPAQRNGAPAPRPLLNILDVEEILPQFFLGDQVGGFLVVLGELAHYPD